MKIHLVDGTYELFRSYFGAPSAQAPDGSEVGATRGLLRSLYSLLKQDDVSHVAIAFDHVIESFRNELFDGYKTGVGIDPDLLSQFPLAERAAHSLGLTVWPMVEFEADDALATAAARWGDSPGVDQVCLCTPDKDLAQAVKGNRVVLVDRRRKRELGEDEVVEKWGIRPASMPDYLALVGDTADGIPGIPRWGAKSSSQVLSVYGHLEDIPADEKQWQVKVRGAAALAENLRERRAEAGLYKTLATLRIDVPLSETLDELAWQGVDSTAVTSLCEQIGDRPFLAQLEASGVMRR